MIFIILFVICAGIFTFLLVRYSGKMSVDNVLSLSFWFGILFFLLAGLAIFWFNRANYDEIYVLEETHKMSMFTEGDYAVKDGNLYYYDENNNMKVIPMSKVKNGEFSEEPYIEKFIVKRKYKIDNILTYIDRMFYNVKVVYIIHTPKV